MNFYKKAVVFLCIILYSAVIFIAGTKFAPQNEEISAAQASQKEHYYTVKLYNDAIWVFSDGEPVKKLNIDYKNLRLYDKELFAKGINVRDLSELAQLEEDFSS